MSGVLSQRCLLVKKAADIESVPSACGDLPWSRQAPQNYR